MTVRQTARAAQHRPHTHTHTHPAHTATGLARESVAVAVAVALTAVAHGADQHAAAVTPSCQPDSSALSVNAFCRSSLP